MTESEPYTTAEELLAAENAIGQVIELCESAKMQGVTVDPSAVLGILGPWTG